MKRKTVLVIAVIVAIVSIVLFVLDGIDLCKISYKVGYYWGQADYSIGIVVIGD